MLALLAAGIALTIARPQGTPGPVMRDFESYYAAGRAFAARENPYSPAIWTYERAIPGVDPARNEVLPFAGPPAFLPLWALFALLPFGAAAFAWGALLVLLAGMVVFVMLSKARALSPGTLAAAAVLLTGFAPFTSDLALGQAAFFSFAAAVAATVMFERAWGVASVWTLLAAVQPNIAIALASQFSRQGAARVFAFAVAAFATLCVVASGLQGSMAYLRGLRDHGAAERFALIQITPSAVAHGFGLSATAASVAGISFALAAIGCALTALRSPDHPPLRKLAVVFALLPFAVPFFHEHDVVVLVLPALLCLLAEDHPNAALAAAGTALVAVDWLGVAQRPEAFLQQLALAVAMLAAMHALADVPLRRLLPAALVLPLLFAAHALSVHAPAPVWPDAMRGVPALGAPVANVWHDELQRTGQFAVQPLWAALRALTLAGCALLAWASMLKWKGFEDSRTSLTARGRVL